MWYKTAVVILHDDIIKWKHFPRYWPFVRGIHRSPVNSPHKGQWRIAFMFSLICAWMNGWVNNREAGDLRCHGAHYDVTIMERFHLHSNTWRPGNKMANILQTTFSNTFSLVLSHHLNQCWLIIIYILRNNISEIQNKSIKNFFEENAFQNLTAKWRPFCSCINLLTHWGRVTHICVNKLISIVSDNGLSPGRRQAIIWTNAGILLIGPLGTNSSEILIEIQTFWFKKMHWKMSSGKWRPFCLGLNVLTWSAEFRNRVS